MRRILYYAVAASVITSVFLIPSISIAVGVASVDQAKVRLFIQPGSSKTGTIKIENPTSEPKAIKIYLEDWIYLPVCDGSKDFKSAGTTALSAANWITFMPSEFTIPPFGRQILNYTVKVPKDAKGGHYAVLFFENYLSDPSKTPLDGVNVNVAIRIASLFYVEPEGTIQRKALIDNLKIEEKNGRFLVTADFINTGNVDITTKGNFFIVDAKGVVYARGEFNDVYTLPDGVAVLASSWKDPLQAGSYDLILSIDMGKALEDLNLGRGPVITKEVKIEIADEGKVVSVGALK